MNSIQANYEFNILYNKMTGIYHDMVKRYNMSECQFWILYALNEENRPLTQSEIVAYLFSPKQTIHSSIQRLLEEELITLKETSGKKKYYTLTNKGKQLSKTTVYPVIQAEIQSFESITEKQRNEFISTCKKMILTLETYSKEHL